MQALIDLIVRNLLQLWPLTRVYSWQRGVRVRGGVVRDDLGPGLHWRWWFLDEVYKDTTTAQALDLATASITTADGASASISANLAYRVLSVRETWLTVWNIRTTLAQVALGEIATRCSQREWSELRTNREALEADLVRGLNGRAGGWGITIGHVNLTDLVVTRNHRHYVDGMERHA